MDGTTSYITLSTQNTTILRGSYSFKVANAGGASAQGEGVSIPITIPKADEQKKLKIEFDFNTDGTYADDELTVYVYDVTNTTLITPSVTGITGWDKDNNGSGKALISFDSTDSNNYRLIFHVAGTATSAWDFYFDNVIVGPGSIVTGAALGPTVDYSSEVDSTVTASYVRDGEYMIISWKQIPTGADVYENVVLPSGYTIDTSVTSTSTNNYSLGHGSFLDSGVAIYSARVSYLTTTTLHPRYDNGTSLADIPALISGDDISLTVRVPIAEWAGSGTVTMLNDDVVNANARMRATSTATTSQVDSTWQELIFETEEYDESSNYDISTGRFTAPTDGEYTYTAGGGLTGSCTGVLLMALYIDGVEKQRGSVMFLSSNTNPNNTISGSVHLNKDEYISIWLYHDTGTKNQIGVATRQFFSVQRISDYTATQTGVGFGLATSTDSGLVSREEFASFDLSADTNFTGGTILASKIGRTVTLVVSGVTHASSTGLTTATAILTANFRPATTLYSCVYADSAGVPRMVVESDGDIGFNYYDHAGGTAARTSLPDICISYVVD